MERTLCCLSKLHCTWNGPVSAKMAFACWSASAPAILAILAASWHKSKASITLLLRSLSIKRLISASQQARPKTHWPAHVKSQKGIARKLYFTQQHMMKFEAFLSLMMTAPWHSSVTCQEWWRRSERNIDPKDRLKMRLYDAWHYYSRLWSIDHRPRP